MVISGAISSHGHNLTYEDYKKDKQRKARQGVISTGDYSDWVKSKKSERSGSDYFSAWS